MAIARFVLVETDDIGNVTKTTVINFTVELTIKEKLKAFLTVDNGFSLRVTDESGLKLQKTEVYVGDIKPQVQAQKMLYILQDVTYSMEPYVKNLSDNL